MRAAIASAVLGLGAVVLGGCSASHKLELLASEGQQSVVRHGTASLVSAKRHVVMLQALEPNVKSGERPSFVVALHNMGSGPVTFRASEIRARAITARGSTSLDVYSYDELLAEEKRRQALQAFGVALGGIGRSMQATNAGTSTTYGTFNAYGPYGQAHGSYRSTTYDSYRSFTAQQLAQAQTSAEFASIRAEGEQNLRRLRSSIIKDHTLYPGEWYGGLVVLEAPTVAREGAARYVIEVQVDGDLHEFSVSQSAV